MIDKIKFWYLSLRWEKQIFFGFVALIVLAALVQALVGTL